MKTPTSAGYFAIFYLLTVGNVILGLIVNLWFLLLAACFVIVYIGLALFVLEDPMFPDDEHEDNSI